MTHVHCNNSINMIQNIKSILHKNPSNQHIFQNVIFYPNSQYAAQPITYTLYHSHQHINQHVNEKYIKIITYSQVYI